MDIGLIGLGRMGFNLARNLRDHGHRVVVYNRSPEKVRQAEAEGFEGTYRPGELVGRLQPPRHVWLMLPAGRPVDDVIDALVPHLRAGDVVIDGGNSHWQDTLRRSEHLKAYGLRLVDVGTSGGIEGARHGACTMIGADEDLFARLEPVFRDISVPGGYLRTGPVGSGHFVKMVHNGIEYGMLQAIGEGFEILSRAPFPLDLRAVAAVYARGSVIRGWLMELTERALARDPKLERIAGVVHHSGEGRWTAETALALGVPAPVITTSVFMRYRSEQAESFGAKVIAALRGEFGGHPVEPAAAQGPAVARP